MNDGYAYREIVGPASAGRTVLDHLAALYRHSTEAEWRARIEGGEVVLEGRVAAPGDRVRPGDVLVWHRPPWEEPAAPLGTAVLYEDAHLLAVAKPSGLPTLPGAGFLEHTLLHLVRRRDPEASPTHRLGRGTSGLVLFARTAEAARVLRARWKDDVVKTYRALCQGVPKRAAFDVDARIGPVPHRRLGTVHAASPAGKRSESRVRVLEVRGDTSLVEVDIVTGRPHQIRIHLAAAGHPLVGDPLYEAGGVPRPDALPGDLGYLLHSMRLVFPHPATGAATTLECAPPPVLRLGG